MAGIRSAKNAFPAIHSPQHEQIAKTISATSSTHQLFFPATQVNLDFRYNLADVYYLCSKNKLQHAAGCY